MFGGKKGENLSGSRTVRVEHTEGEGRGLAPCHSTHSSPSFWRENRHPPHLYHKSLKKTFVYGMKLLFKSKNTIVFMRQ